MKSYYVWGSQFVPKDLKFIDLKFMQEQLFCSREICFVLQCEMVPSKLIFFVSVDDLWRAH